MTQDEEARGLARLERLEDMQRRARERGSEGTAIPDSQSSEYRYNPVDLWPLVRVLAIAVAVYFVVRYLAQAIGFSWEILPKLAASSRSAIGIGVAVIAIGALLFLVRERHRPVYACIELSSAFGVAVEACSRLHHESERFTLIFQLLAATYIAVRGFDNLKIYIVSKRSLAAPSEK